MNRLSKTLLTLLAISSFSATASSSQSLTADLYYGGATWATLTHLQSLDNTPVAFNGYIDQLGTPFLLSATLTNNYATVTSTLSSSGAGVYGTQAEGYINQTDTLTISGGTGRAQGLVIITITNLNVTSSNNSGNAIAQNYIEPNVHAAGDFWGILNTGSYYGAPAQTSVGCSELWANCSYSPASNTLTVPFDYFFDTPIGIELYSGNRVVSGGMVTASASLKLQLPAGSYVTASSGTIYEVEYSSPIPELPTTALLLVGLAVVRRNRARPGRQPRSIHSVGR
jgi:hypothetical protein